MSNTQDLSVDFDRPGVWFGYNEVCGSCCIIFQKGKLQRFGAFNCDEGGSPNRSILKQIKKKFGIKGGDAYWSIESIKLVKIHKSKTAEYEGKVLIKQYGEELYVENRWGCGKLPKNVDVSCETHCESEIYKECISITKDLSKILSKVDDIDYLFTSRTRGFLVVDSIDNFYAENPSLWTVADVSELINLISLVYSSSEPLNETSSESSS